jgi:hypothetical protein
MSENSNLIYQPKSDAKLTLQSIYFRHPHLGHVAPPEQLNDHSLALTDAVSLPGGLAASSVAWTSEHR